jgi:hypothetical protein
MICEGPACRSWGRCSSCLCWRSQVLGWSSLPGASLSGALFAGLVKLSFDILNYRKGPLRPQPRELVPVPTR